MCPMTSVKFAKVRESAIIPSYAHPTDGWLDIYACCDTDIIIKPHEVELIPTGICSIIPEGYRISLGERGSNTKSTLMLMAGKIDADYRGEYFVALYNGNDVPVYLSKSIPEVIKLDDAIFVPQSKAICQAAIEKIPDVTVEECSLEEVLNNKTDRGDGCLGSSGK